MLDDQEHDDALPEDGDYELDRDTFRPIKAALEAEDPVALAELLDPMHPADIADLMEQLHDDERTMLVQLYGREFDGDILSELAEGLREDVVDAMAPEVLAEAVRELETDDVVDLIEDLDQPQTEAVLDALDDDDRVVVEQSLTYPEESAGRLMQRELVVAPEHWNVGQTIDFLRNQDDLPEQFYHVILVDPRMRPIGYVTLGRLMGSPRELAMTAIVEESFRTIPVLQDEAEVAYAFNQYHLISAPVVDASDRLVGVITIDDAMVILDEEHEEDILRLAGVGESNLSDRVVDTTKRRFPWLAVNLVTSILASLVIAQFDAVITQFVALAVLMPIVASMGGNAGTQSLTVAVRALATKDLTSANVWRVIRREAAVGLINGVIFAGVMGVIGILWFGTPILGVVIGVAMVVNLVVAGLAGIIIPVTLERLDVDPALASGAFVTTVTDVVGFFAFLGLAAVMLL
ncbi:magnesium transporter [Aliiroseovarius lamellibrachiae]|uniref:magnesium transporter n=1 Tax=Aliiroseovarius lamellibrachiae TaxID=1924933 RepID=UPI001BE08C8A|nr:magnesium transporter [Aliiroseovarius lamellibrachiae]MBT2129642.1 magnesium transporter [Aliiroseovarius lamellibrachiae]